MIKCTSLPVTRVEGHLTIKKRLQSKEPQDGIYFLLCNTYMGLYHMLMILCIIDNVTLKKYNYKVMFTIRLMELESICW